MRLRPGSSLALVFVVLGAGLGIGLGLAEAPTGPFLSTPRLAPPPVGFCSPSRLSVTPGGYSYSGGAYAFVVNLTNTGTKACEIPSKGRLLLTTPMRGVRDVPESNAAHSSHLVLLPKDSDGAEANGAQLESSIANWCDARVPPPIGVELKLASVGTLYATLYLPYLPPTGCTDPSRPATLRSPAFLTVWVPPLISP